MATVISERNRKNQKVTFSIEAAEAEEVFLTGDFNSWNPKKFPMKKDGNGIWKKTVMLPSGIYEYKFLIDGVWTEDPFNDEACPNCFGTFNSVLNMSVP